ncbi:Trigger factor [Kingella potus]|uniref:Trigger factor n=1 Tax=Kingella potus TaxID=265175 RepID=A0A377R3Y2_9NEIS|nr:trigger factor [Kingella potus]UOO99927.1 trigger factor [Kingella potus]STR03186.1 Trigger factor [Kingella potus]
MSVTLETLENLERKAILSLPWADINAEYNKRLKQTARRARIDGFRPGKAPLGMIQSMYGAGIQTEVMNELAQKVFFDTAAAEGWRIAGMPRLEGIEGKEDQENFHFAGIFEVFPEVKIGDISTQEIEKADAAVSDAEVEKTIEILRRQRTRFNRAERAAQNGDRVIIDFAGTIGGEAFEGGTAQNYAFILGNGQMLPEFEAGVNGLKEGESKDVQVAFPEDYHGKDVAGKTAVFAITVRNVAEPVLPEVDEQFAKALGIADGNVQTMRAEVKKNVEREVKRRIAARNKEAAMDALLAVSEFPVPNALVADEAARLAAEMKQNFINQGMADAKNLDLPADMFTEQAERRIRLGLILAELVRANGLEPTPAQIDAVIADFAESYEDPQEVVEWYHAEKSRLDGPTSLAVEANVTDYVLSQAKVSEKTLSFDEVMGNA